MTEIENKDTDDLCLFQTLGFFFFPPIVFLYSFVKLNSNILVVYLRTQEKRDAVTVNIT